MALSLYRLGLYLLALTLSAPLFAASPNPASHHAAPAPPADTTHPSFLVLSDVHLDPVKQQSGISQLARDAGADTWTAAQKEAATLITDPKIAPRFIIYLGDLPMHGGRSEISTTMFDAGKVLAGLRSLAAQHHIPLIYVPGNNDSPDSDYGGFSTRLFQHDPDTAEAADWPVIGGHILPGSESLYKRIGCYSVYPEGAKSKLRVLVLNTVLFTWNFSSPADAVECREQIDWLGKQLREVRQKGETALIVMHVPPGFDTFRHKTFWTTKIQVNHTTIQNCFLDTLDRYKSHLMGVLSSHTHMDGFKRLYNKNGHFITLLISVPAVAPSLINNSAMKLIRYNGKLQFTASVTYYLPSGADQWNSNAVATATIATMQSSRIKQLVGSLYHTGKAFPNLFAPDIDVRRDPQTQKPQH